jgi:peroxiredoxin Q/BCP
MRRLSWLLVLTLFCALVAPAFAATSPQVDDAAPAFRLQDQNGHWHASADFAAKYHVPFPLLSDADRTVATTCGVLMPHMGFQYAKRTTFLIDLQGRIAKVYVDVDPEKNSGQVMNDLATLKAAS